MIAELLNLNDRQAEALTIDGHGVIAAGAGAGKTQTLAALVCRDLIEDRLDPSQIAICTFTRSAAAKLTSRVADQISRLDVPSDELPDVSRLYAGTIDSLCARLLHENALDAGVPPEFTVGDDRTLMADRRAAFTDAVGQLTVDELVLLGQIADPESDTLLIEVMRALDTLRTDLIDPEQLPDPAPVADRSRQRHALADECEQLLTHPAASGRHLTGNLTRDIQALRAGDPAAFSTGKYGLRASHELHDTVRALSERIRAERQHLADELTHPLRQVTTKLIRTFAGLYRERKQASETLDFLDLALAARRFLTRPGRDPKQGFARLYIDEAQDTSPLQLTILELMLADGGVRISVGDENQSIYAFRRADVKGFRAQAANTSRRAHLTQNYRSQPSVMHAINVICSRVPELQDGLLMMQPEAQQIDSADMPSVDVLRLLDGDRHLSAREEADVVAAHTLMTRDRLGLRNRDICVLCESNQDGAAYADAFRALGVPALLIQRRGLLAREECRDLLAYLRLLDDPGNEEALIRVLSSPFCGLTDMQLHALAADRPHVESDGERRRAALMPLAAAAAPQFAERHERVRRHLGHVPVAELAHHAVAEHNYLVALELADPTGALRRNVEKLIGLIAETEAREHGPALRAVLDTLDAEQAAGIDEGQDATVPADLDAVQVMTVHNAKGDEFPLVVVGRLSKDDRVPPGLLAVHDGQVGVNAGRGRRDSIAEAAFAHENTVRTEEKRRLFYVAATRPQRHLILAASAKVGRSGPSWRGMAKWLFDGDSGALRELHQIRGRDETVTVTGAGAGEGMSAQVRVITPSRRAAAAAVRAAAAARPQPPAHIPDDTGVTLLPLIAPSVSYTQLTRWERCSLRRHLEHDSGLTGTPLAAPAAGSGPVSPTGGRRFGQLVHELLAEHDWRSEFTLDEDDLRVLGLDSSRRQRLTEIAAAVNRMPFQPAIRSADQLWAERRFSLTVQSRTLVGAIDLLAVTGDDALIIDWKTGEDPDDAVGADYQLQRDLYALAVINGPQRPRAVRSVTAHLPDGTVEESVWAAEDAPDLLQRITERMERIMLASPHPAASAPQPFCDGCPGLRYRCPARRP